MELLIYSNSNSQEILLTIAIAIAIVPKMSIAIVISILQCCERHVNLCTSHESLLWRLCLNDLKLFLCHHMTKIQLHTKFELICFSSIGEITRKPPIFHLFRKTPKIGGFWGFSPKLLNQMSSNFVWSQILVIRWHKKNFRSFGQSRHNSDSRDVHRFM